MNPDPKNVNYSASGYDKVTSDPIKFIIEVTSGAISTSITPPTIIANTPGKTYY